jgi:hypothetical protein
MNPSGGYQETAGCAPTPAQREHILFVVCLAKHAISVKTRQDEVNECNSDLSPIEAQHFGLVQMSARAPTDDGDASH